MIDFHSIRPRARALVVLLPLMCFLAVSAFALWSLPRSFAARTTTVAAFWDASRPFAARFLLDVRELNWYYEEGTWFRRGFLPYVEQPYEYPVLATALFTLPALFTPDPLMYHILFRIVAVVAGAWLMYATLRECQRTGHTYLAWLFLLPSVLYFTLNRFDVFPALALQLSLLFLFARRYRTAWAFLAVSFLFKWYAGLLTPLYLLFLFDHARDGVERRRAFSGILLFVGLLLVGHSWLLPLGGTVLDAVNPYAIHFVRPPEVGSLPAALLALISPAFQVFDPNDLPAGDPLVEGFAGLSTLLQLLGITFALVWVQRSSHSRDLAARLPFAHVAFFVIGCFVLFSRVYSQQWIVWLVPLFLFTQPRAKAVALFIALDIANYLQFPVMFGLLQDPFYFRLFTLLTLVRSLLLGVLIVMSVRAFVQRRGGKERGEFGHIPSLLLHKTGNADMVE